jgi:hypothetical protein
MILKLKIFTFTAAIGALALLAVWNLSEQESSNFDTSKKLIIMRKIAHDILVYSGDSTSRILPAQQRSPHEFMIPFESTFAFLPDSLVSIVNKAFANNNLPKNYIVNVIEPNSNQVIFGYVMLADEQQNIIPCGNRLQATQRYSITIQFQPQSTATANIVVLSGGLVMLLVVLSGGVFYWKQHRAKQHRALEGTNTTATDFIPTKPLPHSLQSFIVIGGYHFYPNEQRLEFDNEEIMLTAKEAKLLSIFSSKMNQVVERERLQKEVWEDEGVIVGRSLDMFVSKLRKKLGKDENIKFINIHGKGYKLENVAA